MKYLLTAFLLFSGLAVSAQIVNIPDPVFKALLLTYPTTIGNNIDQNHNGEIEVSEALAVTEFSVYSGTITNITGLEAFQNLEFLRLEAYDIPYLNLSNLLPNLKTLLVGYSSTAQSLNVSGLNNLQTLSCNGLGYNIPGPGNQYFSLTLGQMPRLKSIGLVYTNFGDLDFTGCDSLTSLTGGMIMGGPMYNAHSIDISGLTMLDTLSNFGLSGPLIARNCTGLKAIINVNVLDFNGPVDVTGCISLEEFSTDVIGTSLTSLDFSTCTRMNKIVIQAAKNLHYLNIKNGCTQTVSLGNPGNPPHLNVCADEAETNSILNSLLNPSYGDPFDVSISPNCSFFPGGNYNIIRGKVKLDLNNNGCDNLDNGLSNIPVRITDNSGGITIIHSVEENYKYYSYAGIFNVAPYFPYPYFAVTPVSTTVNFDTANSIIDTADFCITATGIHKDLEVVLLPTGVARPGFISTYRLQYKNKGNSNLSGTIQLNFDNTKMNFSTATTAVASQSAGQLNWDFSNLLPFENKHIDIVFNLLPSPVNNIGDTLIFMAQVNPVINDETPYDNSFILPQLVRGSFDPNEKECLEGSEIDITTINNYLHYLIRFQNLGNDTAFNIVVLDTLSNNVDWNTVEFTGSSHPCHVTQKNGRLEFFFENIQLPYKAINEPASNGYVAFKIKPKNNLALGDSLNNKAAIYFDFNPPVITNTAISIISPQRLLPVTLEYFSANSNGNNNLIAWKARTSDGFTNFIVERSDDNTHYTEMGNITATADRCQSPFDFTDDQPMAGKNYYRLRITGADGNSFYSDVKLIERTSAGLQATAVITDQNNTIVYLNSPKQQTVQMKIIASDGKLLLAQPKSIPAGRSQLILPFKAMAKGIYTLVIYTNDGEMITKRFVK